MFSINGQSFICSKESAEELRLRLEIVKQSKESLKLLESFKCTEGNDC